MGRTTFTVKGFRHWSMAKLGLTLAPKIVAEFCPWRVWTAHLKMSSQEPSQNCGARDLDTPERVFSAVPGGGGPDHEILSLCLKM